MSPKAKHKLRATRVDRIAIVDRPAVPDAQILLYKRRMDDDEVIEEKGATTYQNLPLASRDRAWDAGAAVKRLQKWAGGPKKEDIDWTKYRKGFMWYDSKNADQFGAYKLPHADIIDGKLTAVPRAIFAVVQRIRGTNIPTEDKRKVLAHCKKYYKKMDMEFPEIIIKSMAVVHFNARLVIKMSEAAVDTLRDGFWYTVTDEETDLAEKKATVTELFDELKAVAKNVLLKMAKKIKAVKEKTPTDVMVKWFRGHLRAVATESMFETMRYSVTEIVLMNAEIEQPDAALSEIIDDCRDFAFQMMDAVFKKQLEPPVEVEKEGRKISAARMKKLKAALAALEAIVAEADNSTEKGVRIEVEELEKLREEFEALKSEISESTESIKGIGETVESIKAALKEANLMLTDEEKAELEKKTEEAEAEEKKAEEKSEADTKATEEKAEAEKKEQEEKDAAAEKRLQDIETLGKRFEKTLKVLEEKFSIKTSLDVETEKTSGSGDPFKDALKGK